MEILRKSESETGNCKMQIISSKLLNPLNKNQIQGDHSQGNKSIHNSKPNRQYKSQQYSPSNTGKQPLQLNNQQQGICSSSSYSAIRHQAFEVKRTGEASVNCVKHHYNLNAQANQNPNKTSKDM